jgi:hypothetical protein
MVKRPKFYADFSLPSSESAELNMRSALPSRPCYKFTSFTEAYGVPTKQKHRKFDDQMNVGREGIFY